MEIAPVMEGYQAFLRNDDILGKTAIPMKSHDTHLPAKVFGTGTASRAKTTPLARIGVHPGADSIPNSSGAILHNNTHYLFTRYTRQYEIPVP
jgi:hypothetical protein